MTSPQTPDDEQVIAFLERHNARCPVCDYGLRGVPAAVCPECAAPLRLEIAGDRTNLPAWIFAIISLSLGLGFDGLASIIFAALLIADPPRPGMHEVYYFLGGLVLAALTCGGFLLLTLRRRRRWLRAPRETQWRWAWTIFAAVAVPHALFGAYLVWLT